MQMIYNSEQFVVVGFDLSAAPPGPGPGSAQTEPAPPTRGGYEIVDKRKGREIFIEGAVARSFQQGAQALVEQGPSEEAMDAYISAYTLLAQQPVLMH